jgi:hypothetical protein
MKKGTDKSDMLTDWGVSLLNKLPAVSRNRRKRDASKRRRVRDRQATGEHLHEY